MPLALRTVHHDRSVRDESAIDGNVVGARAAHAENSPGVEHLDTIGTEREWEMQHGRPTLGIFPHSAGDKYIPDGNAAGKDLACGDTPAAGDALSLAGPRNPVRATAADEHEIVCGDASK